MKKLTMIVVMLSVCCALSTARADLMDDFSVAHDYLASGVAGTIWDGILNAGNATTMNTTGVPGQLEISVGPNINVPNHPLLYIDAVGDFTATVEFKDFNMGTNWSMSSLQAYADPMANGVAGMDIMELRLISPADYDRTQGVDWLNGAEKGAGEAGGEGTYWVPFKFYKLERTGNNFQFSVKNTAAEAWTTYNRGPMVRDDLDGVPVKVGVSFFTIVDSTGAQHFDNFTFVPEPATMLLLGFGGLFTLYRRRK